MPKAVVVTPPTTWQRHDLAELLDVIREDYQVHGRRLGRPGFQVLVAYRVENYRRQMRPGLGRDLLALPIRTIERWLRRHYGIELWPTATLGRRVYFAHHGGTVIHRHAVIGDGCIIRQGVTIGSKSLRFGADDHPVIGQEVSLGSGSVIIGRCRVGDNAVIGPNAVVSSDIPNHASAVAPLSIILDFGVPRE